MIRIFYLIFIFIFFALNANLVFAGHGGNHSAKGNADVYKVTMRKIEICTGYTVVDFDNVHTADACHNAVVIGSDQVAFCDGKILKKSKNLDDAFEQISWQVGKQTTFFTGLALVRNGGKEVQSGTTVSHVFYRDSNFISEKLVRNYVNKEKPLNCAGSTKLESLGICFIKRVETEDPSALMGLPLIKLCSFLKKWNVQPFA